ncbi:hypothetical protein C0581_04555 [Candidatus Parcubacteria bacterium]|nr:MAG: hypothetical protein C0581_04555 [Candidatus Parcubacteria bacterium]
MFKKSTLVFSSLLAVAGFLISIGFVSAAPDYAKIRDEGFHAKYISQSIGDPVKIEAGDTVSVVFTFKNIGTKTWDSASNNFVSAYTMNERYRASEFQASNWLEYRQTAKIGGVVRPGETGELVLQLKAPEKAGHYKEEFWLAADGWSWVKGGYFYVEIDVTEKTVVSEKETIVEKIEGTDLDLSVPDAVADNSSSLYQAKKFMQNKKEILAAGGERIKLVIGYQNIGDAVWNGYSFVTDDASLSSSGGGVSFVDDSWENDSVIATSDTQVPQWKAAREKFYVKMPHKQGDYTLTVKLQVANESLEETVLHIPVTVTQDAPSHMQPQTPSSEIKVEKPRLDSEPTIRVGVWRDPEEGVEFISNDDDYIIYAGDTRKGVLKKGEFAMMFFAGGSYQYQSDSFNFMTTKYIRMVPENHKRAVFTLTNYDRKVSWKGPRNFNTYRGIMEYRQTQDGGLLYVINELGFEDYVAGIAETSNGAPIEYIKAILTAARTYAYYIQQNSTKHDARNFDVVAHTGDQLYLGYESETLMPRVKEAQQATEGYMITYDTDQDVSTQSDIVITPYFGNSDGRTRSWTQVWGGSAKPWLVSVPARYDARDGKGMFGHGVGMSARDAAYMADEEKTDWKDIIKYYYTGVEVEKVY